MFKRLATFGVALSLLGPVASPASAKGRRADDGVRHASQVKGDHGKNRGKDGANDKNDDRGANRQKDGANDKKDDRGNDGPNHK